MHDIRLIRDDPEAFDTALARRGHMPLAYEILGVDSRVRGLQTETDKLLSERNSLSKAIGASIAKGQIEDAIEAKAKVEAIKGSLPVLESLMRDASANLRQSLSSTPNRPADDVPDGDDETGNVEQKSWGTKRQFNYAPANHADLGPALGLDFETGALIAGARFTFLRGQMARLQRALGQFMLDLQTAAGFTECAPPLMVREEAMFGTGQLPKFADDSFRTGDRWLIPTSEVSLTNSVREQILADSTLPIKMTALTPCFRSEAGSAGKDTRGYIRQHQFEKVELVTICRPEDSAAEHERMTLAAEAILEEIGRAHV